MPNFSFNPADASAGFPVYPKGTYEITLGEAKPFYRTGKDGKDDNHGIMFVSKISGAEDSKFIGKKFAIQCFQHTSESKDMSKPVQMAGHGYSKNQEDEFDAIAATFDWGYNTDDGSVGNGWSEMSKQVIVVDLDSKMNDKTNELQQTTKNWRPLAG